MEASVGGGQATGQGAAQQQGGEQHGGGQHGGQGGGHHQAGQHGGQVNGQGGGREQVDVGQVGQVGAQVRTHSSLIKWAAFFVAVICLAKKTSSLCRLIIGGRAIFILKQWRWDTGWTLSMCRVHKKISEVKWKGHISLEDSSIAAIEDFWVSILRSVPVGNCLRGFVTRWNLWYLREYLV